MTFKEYTELIDKNKNEVVLLKANNFELFTKLEKLEKEIKAYENVVKNEFELEQTHTIGKKVYSLRLIKSKRLNQKELKEQDPDTFNSYLKDQVIKRIMVKTVE